MAESATVSTSGLPPAIGRRFPCLFAALAGIGFLVCVGLGLTWDSIRMVRNGYALVEATDREVRQHEEKVISLIPAVTLLTARIDHALDNYRHAADPAARRRAYDEVLFAVGAPTAADPTDPIRRRAADEWAGAQNRRAIAVRHYNEAVVEYHREVNGVRGAIGCRLTGLPARIDG